VICFLKGRIAGVESDKGHNSGSILIGVKDTDSDSEFEISCAFSM
jgi:hypothetical protein